MDNNDLDQIEQDLRDGILQTRLRNLVITQVAIVERLQKQALYDTPPADIHTNIRSASEALVNLMDGSGEVLVLVDEGEG